MLVRWALCAGLGSILLLAPLLFPLAVTDSSAGPHRLPSERRGCCSHHGGGVAAKNHGPSAV